MLKKGVSLRQGYGRQASSVFYRREAGYVKRENRFDL